MASSAWDTWLAFCEAARVSPDTTMTDDELIARLNRRRERVAVPDVAGVWTADDVKRIREPAEEEQRNWKGVNLGSIRLPGF